VKDFNLKFQLGKIRKAFYNWGVETYPNQDCLFSIDEPLTSIWLVHLFYTANQ
jgi:hypothetical protein